MAFLGQYSEYIVLNISLMQEKSDLNRVGDEAQKGIRTSEVYPAFNWVKLYVVTNIVFKPLLQGMPLFTVYMLNT